MLAEFRNPVGVITKSTLVARDIDLLRELASHEAAHVALSVTTLDEPLRRVMEPRAPTGADRLKTIARLNEAGVPAGVMIGPVVPGLTDTEIPAILQGAAAAGAQFAGYVMLRLPYGLAPLFEAWLERHFPARKQKVLDRIRDMRGGRMYDSRWGERQRGRGPFADLVANLFSVARARAGIPNRGALSTAAFRVPPPPLPLFDEA